MSQENLARLCDREIVFRNGSTGRNVEIASADPLNYYEVISAPEKLSRRSIDGKLFLPPDAQGPTATVIVVPGSSGVSPNHVQHCETFTDLGMAALLIDPFAARGVTSTVANQAQYSFAASAYDVLAAVRTLAAMPEIDSTRIGTQGHSRGGTAVVTAAIRGFSVPVLGDLHPRAVYAAYPWCGHQFLDPDIGDTLLRAVIGDRDDWCLPQQVQGCLRAIQLRGGHATLGIFSGAGHSFDRETPVELIADAAVSPDSPIHYIAADGALIDPLTGRPDPTRVDYDTFVYALKSGYGRRGAHMGGSGDQPALFRADMIAFWKGAGFAK